MGREREGCWQSAKALDEVPSMPRGETRTHTHTHLCCGVEDPIGHALLGHHVGHLHALVTELIVQLPLARVGQRRVGRCDLLEALCGVGILVLRVGGKERGRRDEDRLSKMRVNTRGWCFFAGCAAAHRVITQRQLVVCSLDLCLCRIRLHAERTVRPARRDVRLVGRRHQRRARR